MRTTEIATYSGKRIAVALLYELDLDPADRGTVALRDLRVILTAVDDDRLAEAEDVIRGYLHELPSAELALDIVTGARSLVRQVGRTPE